MNSSRSDVQSEEPIDHVAVEVREAKAAMVAVLALDTWTCSDGHEHPRPDLFTHRRLANEVLAKHRDARWSSSVVSLAVYALVEDGTLERQRDFTLRRRGA